MRQGVRLEPLLEAISKFLDSQHEMIERVRRDLVRGLKKPRKGRRGLTAPQVLRSLVLMRVKNWDYRELRERIADGVTLRQFTDFYCDPVPKHDAFNGGFNRLTPQTLKAINEMVVEAAVALGLEDGAKLRVDTILPGNLRDGLESLPAGFLRNATFVVEWFKPLRTPPERKGGGFRCIDAERLLPCCFPLPRSAAESAWAPSRPRRLRRKSGPPAHISGAACRRRPTP